MQSGTASARGLQVRRASRCEQLGRASSSAARVPGDVRVATADVQAPAMPHTGTSAHRSLGEHRPTRRRRQRRKTRVPSLRCIRPPAPPRFHQRRQQTMLVYQASSCTDKPNQPLAVNASPRAEISRSRQIATTKPLDQLKVKLQPLGSSGVAVDPRSSAGGGAPFPSSVSGARSSSGAPRD